MVTLSKAGLRVKADGFSTPYRLTLALATALYGFAGLWLSYKLTSTWISVQWAFLATLGIWFASSLPVYMYFNPAYSHAHSVFVVAAFLWYWQRTHSARSQAQWAMLGLLAGLMLDVYYLNISIVLIPLFDSLERYWQAWRTPGPAWAAVRRLLSANGVFACLTLVAFSPTLITRQIIYGHPCQFGYGDFGFSHWTHPALWQPLLSSDHGLLTWTPIAIPALAGLALFRRYDCVLAAHALAAVGALYYIVACHSNWDALSSFGNRFFISLTPFFILGLAVTLQEAARWLRRERAAMACAALAIAVLILWNLGFVFQWGVGLVPHQGPISWKRMAYNQVGVVPRRLASEVKLYLTHRSEMMRRIEQEDLRRWREDPAPERQAPAR
jgi:hypothetical protein